MQNVYKKLSPNHSGKRTHKIDRITPHCVVGQLSVEQLGNIFADPRPVLNAGQIARRGNRSACSPEMPRNAEKCLLAL